MTTTIIPNPSTGAHWYDPLTGEPKHFIPKKDGSGNRPTTLRDARPNGWFPSVTSVLKTLARPQLERWKQEMLCLAVLTAPRKEGEDLDSFVLRVLSTDQEQDQESQIARDKGTQIHAVFEDYFSSRPVAGDMQPIVKPAIETLMAFGARASSEVIVVGEGFAGRTDLIQDCDGCWRIWDIKTTKKLPDPRKGGAYAEHKLQLSAYAKAWSDKLAKANALTKPIIVGNVYVSTTTPGEFVICEHEDWETTFENGFLPLLVHWMWANNYWPVKIPSLAARQEPLPDPQMVQQFAEVKAKLEQTRASLLGMGSELETARQALHDATSGKPAPIPVVAPPRPPAPTMALPTHTAEGKKIQWSTGTPTPATPKP